MSKWDWLYVAGIFLSGLRLAHSWGDWDSFWTYCHLVYLVWCVFFLWVCTYRDGPGSAP